MYPVMLLDTCVSPVINWKIKFQLDLLNPAKVTFPSSGTMVNLQGSKCISQKRIQLINLNLLLLMNAFVRAGDAEG